MPKHKQRGKKNRGGNPFHRAPRQGVGATEDWVINDAAVITLPQTANAGFYTVRAACDVNGFSWTVAQNGALISSFPSTTYFQFQQAYGTENNQFSRLSLLWEQYRVNWIEMEIIPSGASGFFNSTGMFSVVDECDLLNGYEPLGDLIPKLSSQRTLEMHTPYQRVKKHFNLAKWIGQTQEKPWLQTQQAGTTQLVREQYTTQWVDPTNNAPQAKTPGIATVFGINSQSTVSTIVATVRFRCHMSFRQRAALDNGPVLGTTITYSEDEAGRVYRRVKGEKEEEKAKDQTASINSIDLTASNIQRLISRLDN